jgi:hypothetical protein
MSSALLIKDAREHAGQFSAVTLAALAFGVTVLFPSLKSDPPSLLSVSAICHRVAIPLVALFMTLRLFTREHEQGTRAFLAGLPVTAGRVFWTKLAFAGVWLAALSAGITVVVAQVARHRELVALEWLLELIVRGWLVAFVWLSIFAFVAQTGRWRRAGIAAALLLIPTLATLDHPISSVLAWTDTMPTDVEATRGRTDAAPLVVAAIWATIFLVAAHALATKDGGSCSAELHRPLSAGEQSMLFGLLAAVLVVADLDLSSPPDLPAIGRGPVRTAAPPGTVARAVAQRLNALIVGDEVGLESVRWKPFSLVGLSVDRTRRFDDRANYFVVDPNWASTTALPAAALALWQAQGARALSGVDDWSTASRGLPTVWLQEAGVDPPLARLRAAWAHREGLTPHLLRSWPRLRMKLGADIADGVAHVVSRAVVEACGDDGLVALARVVLEPRTPSAWSRWTSAPPELGSVCPEAADFGRIGMAALARVAAEHAEALANLPRAPPPPERVVTPGQSTLIRAPSASLAPGAVLRWATIDPLAPAWRHDPLRTSPIEADDTVALPVHPTRRVVAAIEVSEPRLSTRLTSSLRELD